MKVWKFSKYITAAVLLILLLTAGVYMKADKSLESFSFYQASEAEKKEIQLEFMARNFWKPGEYGNLIVADVEKEYFAVKGINTGDTWKLVDRNGTVLADTEITRQLSDRCGQYFYQRDGEGNVYIDAKNARLVATEYSDLIIHPGGKYMTGKTWSPDWKYWYTVETMDGEVLYEGSRKAVLTEDEGFVVLHGKENSQAYDLNTSEILYETDPGWFLEDRIHGLWIVKRAEVQEWTEDILYLKDAAFQTMLGGQYFRYLEITDKYIYGTAWIPGQEGISKSEHVQAHLHDGTLLFKSEKPAWSGYLKGDILCYVNWGGSAGPQYVNLAELAPAKEGGGTDDES